MVRFDFGPLFQGQTRIAKAKSAYDSLIIGPRDDKPTYGKSLAGNLLLWSDLTLTHLLLVLEVRDDKPTYRKSLAGNLLVWSDSTLGPLFKAKQG